MIVTENASRPTPHIEPLDPSTDPIYLVDLMGNTTINPAVKSLEYIFPTLEGLSLVPCCRAVLIPGIRRLKKLSGTCVRKEVATLH